MNSLNFSRIGANGYYDLSGHWQRTKSCFVHCGDRCDCGPPGSYYMQALDKRHPPLGPLLLGYPPLMSQSLGSCIPHLTAL